MNYIQKYFDEIFESMLNDSVNNGLISHAEDFTSFIQNKEDISNYYIMDKAVIAEMFATVYEDLTNVYNSSKVKYAEGDDLDDIGDRIGITRPLATLSSVEVIFSLDAPLSEGDGDINIEDEIIISTDEGIEYRTLEPIYIPNGELKCTVQCMSLESGVNSRVNENSLNIIVSNIPYDLSCTNINPSNGGNEAYLDEDYRSLLMNWILINLKGSKEAYENYFANLDGIDDYKLIPNWDGTGTMKIIVNPGSSFLLNQIHEEIQDNICQATEDIVMCAPTEKYIDIYAVVNVDIDQVNPYSSIEKEIISSKIINAVKVFIDGGFRVDGSWHNGLSIGDDFIPHKLSVFLDSEIPELRNISFNYPTDFISILDDEQGKSNDINIEMI